MSKKPTSGRVKEQSGKGVSPRKPSEKIKAAFDEVNQFFEWTDLPTMNKLLQAWLLAGIEDQHQWEHEDTLALMFRMEDLMRLVDALWVLHKEGVQYTEKETGIREIEDDWELCWSKRVHVLINYGEYSETDFYTPELSREEEVNPFIVLSELFAKDKPTEVNRKLYFWRDTALTNPWEYKVMDNVEMAALHKRIERVVEAAFIISEVQLITKEVSDEQ